MNQFLDACGATGPLVLGVESAGAPGVETRAFDLPFVLVGRDPRCDLRLTGDGVSDRHAYFQVVGGRLFCADLGSRSGVYHGGRCRRLGDVERDRSVRIGPYRVRLLAGDGPADGFVGAPGRLPAALELSHRSVRRTRCALPEGLALVGSGSDCAVRLVDPSVAHYHCSLVHTPAGVWVVDLLGEGGVRVNGREVGYARAHDGDTIHVGRSEVRVGRPDGDPPAAPRAPVLAPALADVRPAPEPLLIDQAAELVERVVGPLVHQVGLLQQQMVDEFHQARSVMFETFATLHQEQSTFLSHELDQLRQLSQDLHALRADLERQTRLLADRTAPASPPTRLVAAVHGPRVIAGPRGPAAVPARLNGPARPAAPDRAADARDDQIHALLCERIVNFRQAHQTRWQRLVSRLPGASQEKPAP